jgi:hypothetical protein
MFEVKKRAKAFNNAYSGFFNTYTREEYSFDLKADKLE